MNLEVKHFFDEETYTLTYLVFDSVAKDAVVIDPVLNYDQGSSKINTESIDNLEAVINQKKLKLKYILETHAHADHLTGAVELKRRFPQARTGIGKHITKVQTTFKDLFNLKNFNNTGVQFDLLLDEQSPLVVGSFEVKIIFTPGHTPACSSFLIENLLFTGDTLFMPDYGTGRCDFPMGSAQDLYHSVHEKLYKLPDETRFFTCHDYQPNGRKLQFESTIGDSKRFNIQLREETSEDEFVRFREKRDSSLAAPKLLLPSIQVNIDGGQLPREEDNGTSYLKIPIK